MIYIKLGKIPPKRHIQFRKPDNTLYFEELISTIGFNSIYSNVYHINHPSKISRVAGTQKLIIEEAEYFLKPYHFHTDFLPAGDFVSGRKTLLFNNDLQFSICIPNKPMEYFFKNAEADELIFVDKGEGELQTNLGYIKFEKGDYIIIPRNIIYRLEFDTAKDNKFIILESAGPITVPQRYRNEFGQLLEHSPFCERDIRVPEELKTFDEKGDFLIKIKKNNCLYSIYYDYHPFDVVGFDGYFYPWIFNINDFMPITGKIHQPPPVHQTFEAPGFVVCSFVTRMLDYHPLAIPVPYSHSNVDSDEVLYYVDGNFFSRKGINAGSVTLHPAGIPHGPHPGTIEASLGKKETVETAVMFDTFKPLKITKLALSQSDESYVYSWKS